MRQFLKEALPLIVLFTIATLAMEYAVVLAVMYGVLIPPPSPPNSIGLSVAASHAFIVGFALVVGILTGLALTAMKRVRKLIGF